MSIRLLIYCFFGLLVTIASQSYAQPLETEGPSQDARSEAIAGLRSGNTVRIYAQGHSAIVSQTTESKPSKAKKPKQQVSLDLDFIAVSLSYARSISENWLVGGGAGIGFSLLNLSAITGEHFSEGRIIEFLHGNLFLRYQVSESFQMDIGFRASSLYHATGDGAGANFIGGFVNPMLGGRKVKIGSRILLGRFSEPLISEFGINLMPFAIRIIF